MIKKMKTVIMCIIACMLLNLVSMPSIEATDNNAELINLMIALGVYDEDDGMLYENEALTREELAGILTVFYGITDREYSVESTFEDVPQYWASGHIMTVVNYGIMNGYDDGLFRPYENVTVNQALKTLVTLTGYTALAENNGGYPKGYHYAAVYSGILDNIEIADLEEKITKGTFTKLLYNTLNVPLFKQVTFGERNEIEMDDDITLLTEKLNIYEVKGVVTALPYTSLGYSEAAGKDRIRIDSVSYNCNIDSSSFIGLHIEGYYRQTEDDNIGEILYLNAPEKYNEVITITSENVVSATLTSISYDERGKVKTIELPDDLILIYNGKRLTRFTEMNLKPSQGYIKLIDTNDDGTYEYAVANDEINYVIDTISTYGDIVTITDITGKNPLMFYDGSDEYHVRIFDRDKRISLGDLKHGDVLSIVADTVDLKTEEILDESRVYTMYRYTETVQGVVTELGEDTICIDNVEYELTQNLNGKLNVGDNKRFYLNYRDEICAFEHEQAREKYGILKAVDSHKKSLASDNISIKIFEYNGEFTVFDGLDKLFIDGKKVNGDKIEETLKSASSSFAVETGISVPVNSVWQMIRYKTDDNGKLLSIDTVLPNKTVTDNDFKFSFSHTSGICYWMAGTLHGRYGVTAETLLFAVNSDKTNDENYNMFETKNFRSEEMKLYLFDCNETNSPKAILRVTDGEIGPSVGDYEKGMLFDTLKKKVNSSNEAATFMCGYSLHTGDYIEREMLDDSQIRSNTIVQGDFVKWIENRNGLVIKVEKSMSPNGGGVRATDAAPGGALNQTTSMSYGTAVASDDNFMSTSFEGNSPYVGAANIKQLKNVYLYEKAKKRIVKTEFDEVRTKKNFGEADADKVGAYYYNGNIYTLVIYR